MTQASVFPEDTRAIELERRVTALETAARLPLSSIGSGGLRVRDGGTIQVLDSNGDVLVELDSSGITVKEPDGSTLTLLDGQRLRFNRSDGSRQLEVTPAGGLKIYDTNGTTEKVVLNAAGLAIDGILQPALENITGQDSTSGSSISSTESTLNEVDITVPAWADEVTLITFARLQASNLSGSAENFTNKLINDVGGLDDTTDDAWTIPHNETQSSLVALTTTVTSPGATVTVRQRASVTAGTHTNNESRLEVIAIVRRTS